MNYDREVVVNILREFLDKSTKFTEELASERVKLFTPDHLVSKLNASLAAYREVSFHSNLGKLFEDYLSEKIDFDLLCSMISEMSITNSMMGQKIAQEFLLEHESEITEYQLNNMESVTKAMDDFGLGVPEVKLKDETN